MTLESELSDDELEYLTGLLRTNKNLMGKHLEIGTAAGGTLWRMMKSYSDESRPQFVVVDPMTYFPNQLELVKRNLTGHGIDPDSVDFRVGNSFDIFKQAEQSGEEFDFMLIDGSHKFRYVMQDLCWTRLLRTGGIVCMHDYHPKTRGVILSADRFLRKYRNYKRVALVKRLLVIRKSEDSRHMEVSPIDLMYAQLRTPFMQLRQSIDKRINRMSFQK